MTLGLAEDANFIREEGAPQQPMQYARFFTALDDATEAKLSATVGKTAS